jgi:TPR repeat protein
VKHVKLAADQDFSLAQVRFGTCLECGLGLEPSPVVAAEFYERSASLGDPNGLNHFGTCLEFGHGHQKDLHRAFDCYKSAAANGNANAQFNCGFCLQHGLGAAANLTESLNYYEASGNGQDVPDSSGVTEYARCLQYGLGIDAGLEEAANSYGRLVSTGQSATNRPSFRCLRSLNKARLNAFPSRS